MIQLLAMSEKSVQLIELSGLQAIGGVQSSGIRLAGLKSSDDYAVLSLQADRLSIHSLKGKKIGAIQVCLFERVQIADLELIPVRLTQAEATPTEEKSFLLELANLVSFLSGSIELEPVLRQFLLSLLQTFKMEKGFIVAQRMNSKYEIVANEGVSAQDPWLSENLLAETLKSAVPVFIQNVIGSRFESNKSLVATGFLSVFAWPLRFRGENLGALVIGSTKPHSGLGEKEKILAEVYSQLVANLLSTHLNELRLREQVETLRKLRQMDEGPFLTHDMRLKELVHVASRVASTELSVLIQGETGVGKEVLAKWIHSKSDAASGPFVAVNCGAIPENLIESTLFGHKRGAFTGAHADQTGKFQQAQGGTLFLDEIGDLPLPMQVKILRAIQEKIIEPVGASRTTPIQVRILSASHKNLFQLVKAGQFREDLYYRLAEVTLEIPALRERPDDIGLIVTEFLRDSDKRLSQKAWDWVRSREWKGNVRELLSNLRRARIMSSGSIIEIEDFQSGVPKALINESNWLGGDNLDAALHQFLKSKVKKALQLSGGNRKQAAELLGVTPRTLFRYLEDFREELTDLSH